MFKSVIPVFLIFFCTNIAFAGVDASIVGDWMTFDKKTGKVSSLIRIWKKNDQYFGRLAKIYTDTGTENKEVCTRCTGDRYNKRVLGLTIIRDLRSQRGEYVDGHILDPRTGKEYQCVVELTDGGEKLKLRAYIGAPMFGRTEVWTRQ